MYFIWYTFLSELVAILFINNGISTSIIYNCYSIVSSIFYLLFFRSIMKNVRTNKLILGMVIVFIVSVIFNSFLQQDVIQTLQTNVFILGFLLVAIVIILYFIEILNSDKIMILNKLPMFWISIGILLFNICIIPVMIIAKLIGWSGAYHYILLGVNIIMYSCFSYAFILSKKEFNT